MEEILNQYYANNARKLRQIVHGILRKFGGISDKDYPDFYSVANDVFTDIVNHHRYDPGKGSFDGFLYRALQLGIMDECKKRNSEKRSARMAEVDEYGNRVLDEQGNPRMMPVADLCLDAMIGEDSNVAMIDQIPSDFDMDAVLSERMSGYQDETVQEYLDSLPEIQRQILQMKMEDVPVHEIEKRLGLRDGEYRRQFRQITSFENIKIVRQLFANSHRDKRITYHGQEDDIMMTVQTAEKSKPMQYSIASINKKIENRTIRFDHPLQRESDQWSPSMKGNLVSDILQGNPLPEIVFAEQIINGTPVIWDLDGKQRCTNCYSYANDGFKICRNIRKWKIQYLAQIRDAKGRPVLDDNGFPMSQYQECDIRNKKFSQLPLELQEKFLDYTFKCDQYLNCDSEDIAYHIIRYNEGKAMSKSQKGITRIGEEFAALVKEISAMDFFRGGSGYKESEIKNGTLDRVVIESIMASQYLDQWSKQQEIICEYLKENARVEDFREFQNRVIRLGHVMTEEVAVMFDSKNSFLWFGLYARFQKTGYPDTAFVAFLSAFSRSLHRKSVDGSSFDELCRDKKTGKAKATKDKYIVLSKMKRLEKLMLDFLDTKENDQSVSSDQKEDQTPALMHGTSHVVTWKKEKNTNATLEEGEFISQMVGIDLKELQYDLDFYKESLKDLVGRTMQYGTALWQRQNELSLLAIVAYSYREDVDLEEWLAGYVEKNASSDFDQRKRYQHMVSDLKKFQQKQKQQE
ncbi:MAG: hypothetical protein K2J67_11255 [Lachnospiraceae bacterium]|nr:hypothetical protein [Lachnospiraceae bacterium]